MTASSDVSAQASGPGHRRFPKRVVGWTVLVTIVVLALHANAGLLNEQFNLDPAMPWILTALLAFVTWVVWLLWAVFFRRSLRAVLVLLAVPTLWLTFFYPDFGGNADFSRWRPRYWSWQSDDYRLPEAKVTGIDLATSTAWDFPQFLGRERDQVVPGMALQGSLPARETALQWRMDVGDGWSGFAIVNGYAVTQEQRGTEECVTCYAVETGQPIWVYRAQRRHEDVMGMGKVGPRGTPAIDGGRVYTNGGTGILDCLDGATGKLLWSVDVPAAVGVARTSQRNSRGFEFTLENSTLNWGRSASPLVVDDLVVIPAGGPQEDPQGKTCTLIAFDKVTGEERWRGGERMISYGSPNLAVIDGVRQITLISQSHAVGHEIATGRELWAHERPGNSNADANCSQVTQVGPNRLLLSKAYGLGGELIEVSRDEQGEWLVQSLQQDPRILKTKFTNPVIIEGHAYSLSDGFLECVAILDEAPYLKRQWKERGRFGDGQLLAVGDKLLVHAEDGRLILVQASPAGYQPLDEMKTIEGLCWNTLAIYRDLLLVRSELEAACFRLPLTAATAETVAKADESAAGDDR